MCPENHIKRGTKRGTQTGFRAIETERDMMKMTNKHQQVSDPWVSITCTYRLANSNECFGTSNKVVPTKTDERALGAGAK